MGTTIARVERSWTGAAWPVVEVPLVLATAAIHLAMGGWLFTLNAVGYGALALALVAPGPVRRVSWVVRLGLLGFTLATIGGWLAFGGRFPLAYLDKSIEAVLIAIVAADIWRHDGNPIVILQRLLAVGGQAWRAVSGKG